MYYNTLYYTIFSIRMYCSLKHSLLPLQIPSPQKSPGLQCASRVHSVIMIEIFQNFPNLNKLFQIAFDSQPNYRIVTYPRKLLLGNAYVMLGNHHLNCMMLNYNILVNVVLVYRNKYDI